MKNNHSQLPKDCFAREKMQSGEVNNFQNTLEKRKEISNPYDEHPADTIKKTKGEK